MDLASVTTSGVLVLDRTGAVFSLLRALNLGVPLWRITTAAEIDHADISLTVVAAYDQTDWPLIGELAESMTTVILTTNPNPADAAHAVAMGAFGYVDTHLPSEALRRSILGAMRGEHAYSRRVLDPHQERPLASRVERVAAHAAPARGHHPHRARRRGQRDRAIARHYDRDGTKARDQPLAEVERAEPRGSRCGHVHGIPALGSRTTNTA